MAGDRLQGVPTISFNRPRRGGFFVPRNNAQARSPAQPCFSVPDNTPKTPIKTQFSKNDIKKKSDVCHFVHFAKSTMRFYWGFSPVFSSEIQIGN